MAIRPHPKRNLIEVYWYEKTPDGSRKFRSEYFPNTAAGKQAAEQKNQSMGFGRRKTRKKIGAHCSRNLPDSTMKPNHSTPTA